MPYVCRDVSGEISGVQLESAPGAQEYLDSNDPRLIHYLSASKDIDGAKLALNDTDAEFARVTEDLIHLLVSKQTILFTELPDVVQRKLLAREQIRECLRPIASTFLSEDDTL